MLLKKDEENLTNRRGRWGQPSQNAKRPTRWNMERKPIYNPVATFCHGLFLS
jgi:hypothetical protein